MNIQQLITLSQQTGFPDPATAAAIAMAESGGNPRNYNPETAARGGTPPGQGSYGLWQIYLKAHPEFAGQNLYNEAVNARAAYSVSGGGSNWGPWSTWWADPKNRRGPGQGAYRRFLTQGQAAAGQQRPASDGGQSTGIPTGLPVEAVPPPPDESGIALPPALIVAALAVVAALAFG